MHRQLRGVSWPECKVKLAVVTALLGSRDYIFAPPQQDCVQFFLFTNWTAVGNPNASRWTVVTPHRATSRSLVYSQSWHDAFAAITSGFDAPRAVVASAGRYAGKPLPFDLSALGYTTQDEHQISRYQV